MFEMPNYGTMPSGLSEDAEKFISLFESASKENKIWLWNTLQANNASVFNEIHCHLAGEIVSLVLGG